MSVLNYLPFVRGFTMLGWGCFWVVLSVFPVYSETVEQLVRRLDSPVLREREAAQQSLFELGPGILANPPGDSDFSTEVAVRLKNLRRMFLAQAVDQGLSGLCFTMNSLDFQEDRKQTVAKIGVDWSKSLNTIHPIRLRFPLDAVGLTGVYDIPVAPEQTKAEVRFALEQISSERQFVFHGRCEVLFAAGIQDFSFSLADNTGNLVRRENAVVSIREIMFEPRTGRLNLRFLIEFDDALDAMQSHQIWIESNPAFLVDEKGEKINAIGPPRQIEKTGNRFDGILSFRIPKEGKLESLQFVYRTPTTIAEKTVEFQCEP